MLGAIGMCEGEDGHLNGKVREIKGRAEGWRCRVEVDELPDFFFRDDDG